MICKILKWKDFFQQPLWFCCRLLNEERKSLSPDSIKSETPTDLENKKVKTENVLISDITLEENIIEQEAMISGKPKQRKSRSRGQVKRNFKCEKCDKNYKFASGLHYHVKHGHLDDKKK